MTNLIDSIAEIVFEDDDAHGGQTYRIQIRELVT